MKVLQEPVAINIAATRVSLFQEYANGTIITNVLPLQITSLLGIHLVATLLTLASSGIL